MIPTSQLPAWTDGPQHWCADVADMFGRYYPSQNPHLVLHVAAVLSANANKKTGRKCMLGRNNIAKTLGTTERSVAGIIETLHDLGVLSEYQQHPTPSAKGEPQWRPTAPNAAKPSQGRMIVLHDPTRD